jgi:Flp pilus assembly protein CpaB
VSRPGSRRRALAFAVLAAVSALASIAVASRYRDGVAEGYGELRSVVVVERELRPAGPLDAKQLRDSLLTRQVPERFVPPDALSLPSEALGSRPRTRILPGSYLLGSQLSSGRRPKPGPSLPDGLRPIEVAVASAAGLEGAGGRSPRVDVVAADEPGTTVNPRVRVLARRVPLLAIRRARGFGDPGGWLATLGLARVEALAVIEAENFARQIRLLPR